MKKAFRLSCVMQDYRANRHLNCRYLALRNKGVDSAHSWERLLGPAGSKATSWERLLGPAGSKATSHHSFELLLDSLHTASLHFAKTEMDVLMQLEDAHICGADAS